MNTLESSLTIYFEDPFWVGLYQRGEAGRLTVCRIVFGAEPRDAQVYEFLLKSWHRLRFSPPAMGQAAPPRRANPKRLQREISRQLQERGVGSKAKQALKLQQEEGKQARKVRSRQEREAGAALRFALRQQKKKEKHRGR